MSGDFLNSGKGKDVEIPELEYRCPHCNEILGEDRSFCHTCGKYLGKENGQRYAPIPEKRASKIRWIVGIAAVIIFLIIFFIVK